MARFNAQAFIGALIAPAIADAQAAVIDSILAAPSVSDGLESLQASATRGLADVAQELDPRRIVSRQLSLDVLLDSQRELILEAAKPAVSPEAHRFLRDVLSLSVTAIRAAGKAFTAT